jgi:hypothetical protein
MTQVQAFAENPIDLSHRLVDRAEAIENLFDPLE